VLCQQVRGPIESTFGALSFEMLGMVLASF